MQATTTSNAAFVSGTKQSKVDRYKWKAIDAPGSFEQVHKDELHVDPTYQRDAKIRRAHKIAKKWSWVACGVIIAARRDGRLYVIDGGHRVMAARHRADIAKLPCIIFETEDPIEEATGFLTANTERRAVTAYEKFRALVITGDAVACKIQELIEASNFTLTDSGGGSGSTWKIKCVRALMECYRYNHEAFLAVWPILLELAAKRNMDQRVVCGIFHLEHCANVKGVSIAKPPYRQRIIRIGQEALIMGIQKAAAYYSKGGNKVWATGIQDLLNHGARNRLDVIGSELTVSTEDDQE